MQRRDGEVMISFFKAAVNHSPDPKEGDPPADSVSQETAASVEQAAKSAREHPEEAKEVLEATDVLGQEVFALDMPNVMTICTVNIFRRWEDMCDLQETHQCLAPCASIRAWEHSRQMSKSMFHLRLIPLNPASISPLGDCGLGLSMRLEIKISS